MEFPGAILTVTKAITLATATLRCMATFPTSAVGFPARGSADAGAAGSIQQLTHVDDMSEIIAVDDFLAYTVDVNEHWPA
jgi:hypothetical protein